MVLGKSQDFSNYIRKWLNSQDLFEVFNKKAAPNGAASRFNIGDLKLYAAKG
jgi:hypothetical protein